VVAIGGMGDARHDMHDPRLCTADPALSAFSLKRRRVLSVFMSPAPAECHVTAETANCRILQPVHSLKMQYFAYININKVLFNASYHRSLMTNVSWDVSQLTLGHVPTCFLGHATKLLPRTGPRPDRQHQHPPNRRPTRA
jgi:hypothetical protein